MYQGKIFINSLFAFFPQESKTMYHKRKVKCKLVICLTSSAAISTNDSPCFQERESFLSFSFLLPSNVKPINFFPSLYSLLRQMSAIIILNLTLPPLLVGESNFFIWLLLFTDGCFFLECFFLVLVADQPFHAPLPVPCYFLSNFFCLQTIVSYIVFPSKVWGRS